MSECPQMAVIVGYAWIKSFNKINKLLYCCSVNGSKSQPSNSMPTEKWLHFSCPRKQDTPAWYAIWLTLTNCFTKPFRSIKKWLETRKWAMDCKNASSFLSNWFWKSLSMQPEPYSNGGSEILCSTISDIAAFSGLGSKLGSGFAPQVDKNHY